MLNSKFKNQNAKFLKLANEAGVNVSCVGNNTAQLGYIGENPCYKRIIPRKPFGKRDP